jgi:hypothetical protein
LKGHAIKKPETTCYQQIFSLHLTDKVIFRDLQDNFKIVQEERPNIILYDTTKSILLIHCIKISNSMGSTQKFFGHQPINLTYTQLPSKTEEQKGAV